MEYMPFPDKKYNIIYADPPWSYRDKARAGKRGAGFKYQTQENSWINSLPVVDIADDDCILFLWVTMPKLGVGLKDCTVQTFRAGGKGGQHQNKTETGVRIIHNASGAVGECRDERSQFSNKKMAFLRMAESEKFKKWHRIETARRFGYSPKEELRKDFTPTNIKVESKANNKWEIDENLAVTQNEINGIIDEVTQ